MRRFSIPTNVRHRYRLFAPNKHFRKFRIKRYTDHFEAVIHESLTAINSLYLTNKISEAEARTQVELLIERLYKEDGVKVSRVTSEGVNESVLQDYIDKVINRKTKQSLTSRQAHANYMRLSVAAIGEHSLLSADVDTLQAALDEKYPDGDNRQIRLARSLNTLLKFIGRDIKLQANQEIPVDVRHIPFDKFDRVAEFIESVRFRVLCKMALYSGLRIGELMALENNNLIAGGKGISVQWQRLRSGKKALPKCRKRREAAIFKEASSLFDEWIELKSEITDRECA